MTEPPDLGRMLLGLQLLLSDLGRLREGDPIDFDDRVRITTALAVLRRYRRANP